MGTSAIKSRLAKLLPISISDKLRGNQIKANSVSVERDKLSLTNTSVVNATGSGNRIIVSKGARLSDCTVYFSGDNNTVYVGENCKLNKVKFWLEDSGNEINIGNGTTTSGQCEFAAIEGTKINIGNDCMFSSDVRISTGDSHSIISDGKRINPSEDVNIGDHVWIGTKVNILKGSSLKDNSIVGTCALVTSAFEESGVVVAGVPAKVIKKDIDWKRERI